MHVTLVDDPKAITISLRPLVVLQELQQRTIEIIEPIPHFDVKGTQITFAPAYVKGEFSNAYAGDGGCAAFQVVFVAGDNTIRPANANEPSHAGRILGIIEYNYTEGALATIKTAGEVHNPEWNLEPGEIYFASSGGEITKIPPPVGFVQKIGVAKTPQVLILQIGEAVLR